MTQIEQILAEIERLYCEEAEKYDTSQEIGAKRILDELSKFINSLPAEQPSKDLEEEINDYFERHFEICNDNTLKCGGEEFGTYELLDVIEHFTHWQKEQTIKKAYNWLNDNFYQYGEDGRDNNGCSILYDFKNAMEKEDEQ